MLVLEKRGFILWHLPPAIIDTYQTFNPKKLVYGYTQQRYTWASKGHRHQTSTRHSIKTQDTKHTKFKGMVSAVPESYQICADNEGDVVWCVSKGAEGKGFSAIVLEIQSDPCI